MPGEQIKLACLCTTLTPYQDGPAVMVAGWLGEPFIKTAVWVLLHPKEVIELDTYGKKHEYACALADAFRTGANSQRYACCLQDAITIKQFDHITSVIRHFILQLIDSIDWEQVPEAESIQP